MAKGINNSLKNLSNAKNVLEQQEKNIELILNLDIKNTNAASFTVSKEIYLKIDNLAKKYKSTKTEIVEALLKQIYDVETGNLLIDIQKKEKIQRKPLNIRLDKKYDKALKKISKETDKSYGEILTEILNKA